MRKKMRTKIVVLTALIFAFSLTGVAQPKTTRVKVYLVALDDKGKTGRKIGCDDSLVPVTRTVRATPAPLKAAVQELLSISSGQNDKLQNFWGGGNLRVKSVSVRRGTAVIHLTGNGPSVAGICDQPRITEQIEATARQFSSVRRVR
ncbi:MAG TPA: GerMN domain-containing protein, partial [Pyrinomonadaceae bacterium]|nr:GerMN domain-containing protein [Pyrinomonadaceae bacterium]